MCVPREFRIDSRRTGSAPQCSRDLARKNSLSFVDNKIAKLLLDPRFSLDLGILAQVITFTSLRLRYKSIVYVVQCKILNPN